MLPRRDGLAVIDQMRRHAINTPVLILSARRSVDDRVKGLQAGGDDYLTKPFAFAELLARVQALVRRATRTPEPTTLTVGDLVLDLLSRRVTRGGTPIDLQPREFTLLEYLMRNAGRVVSKTMIVSRVWEYSFDPQTNIVDVLVSRLREKIDRPFETAAAAHRARGGIRAQGRAVTAGQGAAGRPLLPAFGLRLALWYAALFVGGSVVIVFMTYWLTAASLAQRDREILDSKLGQYAAVYQRGGLRALTDTVQAEQRTAPERLFVRVVDRGEEAIVLSQPEGWDLERLETASLSLTDGTLVQVGKSTDAREELLARFRAVLGLVTLTIVVVALTGGFVVTRSAVRPIRRLTRAVARIVSTGRTDERVPLPGGGRGDAIDELTRLFNAMLDRIEGLVTAMRGALDNVSHDLRTPLTRLRGTAEMALVSTPDPDRYRDALADCLEESDRVLVMLNTLMDISEAESGAMHLHRDAVQLGDVVARAVESVPGRGGREGHRADGAHSRRRRGRRGPHEARAGRRQPDRQRAEIHPGRRPRGRRGAGRRSARAAQGPRYRPRHPA